MKPDNKESHISTETDQLRHEETKPDFLTQRPISHNVPLFNILYGSRKPSYRKLREGLDAVVPLTVTWLGPDEQTRKLSAMLQVKKKRVEYWIWNICAVRYHTDHILFFRTAR